MIYHANNQIMWDHYVPLPLSPLLFSLTPKENLSKPFLLVHSSIMSHSSDIFLSSTYGAPPSDFLEYVANSHKLSFSPLSPQGANRYSTSLQKPQKALNEFALTESEHTFYIRQK